MNRLSLREKILASISLILFSIIFFGQSHLPNAQAKDENNTDIFQELKAFTDVLSIVRRDYVEPVGNKKLVEGAIKGMLTALDPHSGYLDPDFYQDLQVQTKGEFGGLGIEITAKDGLLIVVAPMEDSPAAKAGVKAGDAIVKIDGKFTKDYSLVDAVKKLRGPQGSSIMISIMREGRRQPLDINIIREKIQVRSVKSRYLDNGYGYVRISQFMEKTSSDLKKALENMEAKAPSKKLAGLIIDMRNNPGGLLTQAVKISDMFLTEGVIVYTEGRVEAQKQKFYAHSKGTEPHYPIVVLVNGGSASASEIVAGAFKDHGRALVLGTQTFGKGSVQTITPLRNGGAITLTTALYYTKSGKSIQADGVTPDIIVEPKKIKKPRQAKEEESEEEDLGTWLRESDLPGAIENPNQKKQQDDAMRKINKTPVVKETNEALNIETVPLNQWAAEDAQFARAYELLKTYNIFKEPNS
jgi:carboxyl-terminal processing protease